jgi:hypothetical protein
MFTDPFRTTATIFVIVTILVFLTKPSIFFDQDGQMKSFGTQMTEHETPITLCIFIYGTLVLTYLLIVWTDTLLVLKQ